MSSGDTPDDAYTWSAAARVISAPTSTRRSSDSKVSGVSVVIAWLRITTLASMPCRLAYSGVHSTAAAAPQVGGQHIRRVRGSKIIGEPRTSSTVTGSRNTAYGLFAAWARAFTEIFAKVSGEVPYLAMWARPAPPK